jgi:hypothetical protein
MKISQPTLSRLLKEARKKLSDAIVNGQAIKIQGGNFKMDQPSGKGFGLRRKFRRERFTNNPNEKCICPKCGHKENHPLGKPCSQIKCPKCGSSMIRE